MASARRASRLPLPLLPVLLVAALVAGLVAVVLLVGRGRDREPPRAGPFTPPAATRPIVALDVQQVRGGVLTLGGENGSFAATPAAGVPVYALRPATPADAAPGDWVTVIGIWNEVLNFAIHRVIIIPAALGAQPDADGIPRLPSGLAGYEITRDGRDRPVLAGRVIGAGAGTITLTAGDRTTTLDVSQPGPLQRLTPITPADIREGDRLAYLPPRPGASIGEAAALLVLPGP